MSASAEPGVPTVHGGTRVLGVIGWPVAHSLSPVIHNAAFRALAMDRVYVPLPVAPDGLARAIEGLRSLGFEGANVTMPHKEQSADLADELSDDARLLHAVNTLVLSERTVMGENTDVIGFERFLRDDTEFDPDGAEALILGAGGAARAVALALARCGASSVTVAVRDIAGAAALVEIMDGTHARVEPVEFRAAEARTADLVVNATPIGSDGRSMPPLPKLGGAVTVVDLLYDPARTPWRAAAERAGARSYGGLGMLLHQAAASFQRWTGLDAPMDVMSSAAIHCLSHRG